VERSGDPCGRPGVGLGLATIALLSRPLVLTVKSLPSSAAFLKDDKKKNCLVEPYYFIFGLTFMLSPMRNAALDKVTALHSEATVSYPKGKVTATPPQGDRKGPIPSSTLLPPLQRLRGTDELQRIDGPVLSP
jgi:hypothetical protein